MAMQVHPALKPLKFVARPFLKWGAELALRSGLVTGARAYGYEISVPPGFHGSNLISLYLNGYEKNEIGLLRSHFRKAACIVEIGCNIGVSSRVAFEEGLAPGGRMICVEPNPDSFPYLMKNLAAAHSDSSKSVIFHNAAIGEPEKSGQRAEFFQRRDMGSGLASHSVKNCAQNVIHVPLISLKDVLRDAARPWSLICDAEGAEIGIIEQGEDLLKDCEQAMIEFHRSKNTGLPQTPEQMHQKMRDLGFKLKAKSGDSCYFSRDL